MLLLEMSVANPLGERHGFMANCSNSESTSAKPQLQSPICEEHFHVAWSYRHDTKTVENQG